MVSFGTSKCGGTGACNTGGTHVWSQDFNIENLTEKKIEVLVTSSKLNS